MAILKAVLEFLGALFGVFRGLGSKIKAWLRQKPVMVSKPKYGFGYVDLGFCEYAEVKWLLKYPNPGTEREDYLRHYREGKRIDNPSDAAHRLRVEGPYCPKCETELSELKKIWIFWKKYRWSCDACDFKMGSKKCASQVREAADRVFEARLRKKFETGREGAP